MFTLVGGGGAIEGVAVGSGIDVGVAVGGTAVAVAVGGDGGVPVAVGGNDVAVLLGDGIGVGGTAVSVDFGGTGVGCGMEVAGLGGTKGTKNGRPATISVESPIQFANCRSSTLTPSTRLKPNNVSFGRMI